MGFYIGIGLVVMFFTLLVIESKLSKMIVQNEQMIELLSKGPAKSEGAE